MGWTGHELGMVWASHALGLVWADHGLEWALLPCS